MPKISKNKLEKNIYDSILGQLVAALAHLQDKKEMMDFVDGLFTQTERLMLAKRLAIAVLLEKGLTYPAISKRIKVSSVTISFVRNSTMKNNDSYRKLVETLSRIITIQ